MSDGTVDFVVPLHITVRIGNAVPAAAASVVAGREPEGIVERLATPWHDDDYSERTSKVNGRLTHEKAAKRSGGTNEFAVVLGDRFVVGASGNGVDVNALKAVYPSHYEDVRKQCLDHMALLQHRLPYVKRLNLSILLDVPVDPALTPEALSVYQAPPPPAPESSKPPAPIKPLPTGMVEPTTAQRYASK